MEMTVTRADVQKILGDELEALQSRIYLFINNTII
jgi:hypothetical protein|nr:MAG TPA: hypothetical protein [Caudoviricetes sp.]